LFQRNISGGHTRVLEHLKKVLESSGKLVDSGSSTVRLAVPALGAYRLFVFFIAYPYVEL